MTYTVKETYFTFQGEGAQTGRPAVFLRFAGCNLWSGLEKDREKAICTFCDTDFIGTNGPGGGKFKTALELANHARKFWPGEDGTPLVVATGGEPLLQIDNALIMALHDKGFEIAVETNGTIKGPEGLDWICVSPKANQSLKQTTGDELKLVYPQENVDPATYTSLKFRHFFLQPMDGPTLQENTKAALAYARKHPQWHISIQTHKLIGID